MSDAQDSISAWLVGLKNNQSIAAQRIHQHVYEQLVRQARRRLAGQRLRGADEEDVALSAFHSFCTRAVAGQFPQLANRDDLWKILVTITTRKCGEYLRQERRLKRGGGEVRGESVFLTPGDGSSVGGIARAADDTPTPELAILVTEQCQQLLACLGDETLAQIAIWKMEGFTDVEVAQKLGCVVRTVERKAERIRSTWSRFLAQAN